MAARVWIFNVRTDGDACDCIRGLYGHRKRVCTESCRTGRKIPCRKLEPASVLRLGLLLGLGEKSLAANSNPLQYCALDFYSDWEKNPLPQTRTRFSIAPWTFTRTGRKIPCRKLEPASVLRLGLLLGLGEKSLAANSNPLQYCALDFYSDWEKNPLPQTRTRFSIAPWTFTRTICQQSYSRLSTTLTTFPHNSHVTSVLALDS